MSESGLNSGRKKKRSIPDSGNFDTSRIDELEGDLKSLVERRKILGPCYRLFYQHPLHLVRGKGTRLFDADGVEYLDAYNNIPSIGHCNPLVAEAVYKQMGLLNTHTRYLHEGILDYAERLLATMPEELDRVMFMCSGSEANDLAVRCAKLYTGGDGIIVTRMAYHGNTDLISGLSPSFGEDVPMSPSMRMIPAPDTFRLGTDAIGPWMCKQIEEQIADMKRHGFKFAGVLFDSLFTSDGVYPGEPGFLKQVVDLVHQKGGVYIADEVQSGFCRSGEAFWGFGRHGIVPDIVTMGKPMANGIACSGMAIKHEVLEAFASKSPYFNTFAGNPVAMAAALAVLDYLEDEEILAHTQSMGKKIVEAVKQLAERYPVIGDVRGAGLFIGIEIVVPGTLDPNLDMAIDLVEEMRERRVLLSLCGDFGNVLKIRPPLVFSDDDLGILIDALSSSLEHLCEKAKIGSPA